MPLKADTEDTLRVTLTINRESQPEWFHLLIGISSGRARAELVREHLNLPREISGAFKSKSSDEQQNQVADTTQRVFRTAAEGVAEPKKTATFSSPQTVFKPTSASLVASSAPVRRPDRLLSTAAAPAQVAKPTQEQPTLAPKANVEPLEKVIVQPVFTSGDDPNDIFAAILAAQIPSNSTPKVRSEPAEESPPPSNSTEKLVIDTEFADLIFQQKDEKGKS